MARDRYDHKRIESEAQEQWAATGIYQADLADSTKEPLYLLTEFPYPSGDLHTGHWYAFAIPDIYARLKRMQGHNVLFPIGFDAFGLPAENAAIKRGLDPKKWTYDNMDAMRSQLRTMGTSLDWTKEVVTCSPEYYHWTQWLFLKLYEHGLAERRTARVKWCPKDKTVLANEQVIAGACERCGSEVGEQERTQWFLKITQYAKRLLEDLDALPWREEIKDAQRAWIGKSEGARISFAVQGVEQNIDVFTTRPDTLFGVTYLVVAPEHPLVSAAVDRCTNPAQVQEYVDATKRKSERERLENKEKTGVCIEGVTAKHPLTGQELPIYIADYVLATYGTGAVMAVPAHDERDFAFATKFNLPIVQVVAPSVIDERNPPREGAEDTERNIILAVVHDPRTDRYLTLAWKEQPWVTFITGGIEEGEESDPIEAARREIAEETGYTGVAFVRDLGTYQSKFYAAHKGVNRTVLNRALLFTLTSDAQQPRDADEVAQYDLVWKSANDVAAAGMQHAEFPLFWKRVLQGNDAYGGDGVLINSGQFNGLQTEEAKHVITQAAEGSLETTYRLRDWLVSRQRYWGCPIPIVYDPEGNPHPVPADHLPWLLPEDVDFSQTDGSPLATSAELRERVTRLFGEGWTPEVDTLDTFVDSSWYFMRYLAPDRADSFSDAALMQKWLPVHRYSGGSEHTTMHLLYARFFYKALFDLALVPTAEPFGERFNRGLILGTDGQKMSKSKGNTVNPDEYVQKYGADAVRAYLAFMGPYNEPGNYPWKPEGVESMRRFLDRVYSLRERVSDTAAESEQHMKACARAAAKVAEEIDRFKMNTAVSALMILMNELEESPSIHPEVYSALVHILAPIAPHLAEHLFALARNAASDNGAERESIHVQPWPTFDGIELAEELVTIGVQVAGKRRGEIQISPEATEGDALSAALAEPAVTKALLGGSPSKVVYVPGRILNLIP